MSCNSCKEKMKIGNQLKRAESSTLVVLIIVIALVCFGLFELLKFFL
jgi:hypothetical protein